MIEAEWLVTVTGRLPRLAWLVQAVGGGRERSWRAVEGYLDERLAEHPELRVSGDRVRSTRAVGWWARDLRVEQTVIGPYSAELAERW